MSSKFSIGDYTKALQNLMPMGIAWPRHPDSVQAALLKALGQDFQKNDASAQSLLKGAFPSMALELLDEWEETLGLPDPCSISEQGTIQARRGAITSRLVSEGSLSKAYMISVCAALGYTITITEYRQARAGWSVAGDPINGEYWPFTWKVTAPDVTYTIAKAGQTFAGEPLRSWGNKTLPCTLERINPAHTVYLLEYVEVKED